MDKQNFLDQVRQAGSAKLVNETELLTAYRGGNVSTAQHSSRLARILYVVGGLIVFLGIVILVAQNWEMLGSAARVVITLGSGLAAYIVGLMMVRQEKTELVGRVFFLLSVLLLPLGLGVTFYEAGLDFNSSLMSVIFSAILFAIYLLSWNLLRYELMATAAVIFGTALFFALTNYLIIDLARVRLERFEEYRILVVGLIYLLLGYNLSIGTYKRLANGLYVFGLIGFLGSALALGGYAPRQNVFWEIIFPALTFLVILVGLPLKSRSFLFLGSVFLMIYIVKISAEYFEDSFGWPLALVLAGFALMGVGYLSFYLNRRYIAKS